MCGMPMNSSVAPVWSSPAEAAAILFHPVQLPGHACVWKTPVGVSFTSPVQIWNVCLCLLIAALYPPISGPPANMYGNVPGYEGALAGGGESYFGWGFLLRCLERAGTAGSWLGGKMRRRTGGERGGGCRPELFLPPGNSGNSDQGGVIQGSK